MKILHPCWASEPLRTALANRDLKLSAITRPPSRWSEIPRKLNHLLD
jgi:hypothetical protein